MTSRPLTLPRIWKVFTGCEDDSGNLWMVEGSRRLYARTVEQWGDRIKVKVVLDDRHIFTWLTNCSWQRLEHAAWIERIGLARKWYWALDEIDEELVTEWFAGMGDP